jgi:hypothetical protein
LKIPARKLYAVTQRRTDNPMIEKTLHSTLTKSNMNNKIGSELICPRGV